tara:strand:+ start:79801 stop:79941 length:141 start_codon:yes stop_codon:yes gene_type:complete
MVNIRFLRENRLFLLFRPEYRVKQALKRSGRRCWRRRLRQDMLHLH